MVNSNSASSGKQSVHSSQANNRGKSNAQGNFQ